MDDAIEILDEIEYIIDTSQHLNEAETLAIIWEYIQQKRIEYKPTTNAKWEEIK